MHLSALQSATGRISLLALDTVVDLAELLGLDVNLHADQDTFQQILIEILAELGPHSSGIAVETAHSFPLALAEHVDIPLVINIVQPKLNADPVNLPTLQPQWGIEEIANNYAMATLTLWYHPAEAQALEKKRLVAELNDYCHHLGIDFMLQLYVYHQPDEAETAVVFQENQQTAIQEMRSMCDLLVLQYPQDPLVAATLTAELDQPWLVKLDGVDYDTAKQQLRTALENGASGYYAGEVFWQALQAAKNDQGRVDLALVRQLLRTTVRDQVVELTRIAAEYAVGLQPEAGEPGARGAK